MLVRSFRAGDEAPIVSTSKDVGDEFRNVGVYRLPYPLKTFQITSVESELIKVGLPRWLRRFRVYSKIERFLTGFYFSDRGHVQEQYVRSIRVENEEEVGGGERRRQHRILKSRTPQRTSGRVV